MPTPATQLQDKFKGDNLSVRMTGAAGDGVTDDRDAITRAIKGALLTADALGSDSISLIIPNGDYHLTTYDAGYNPLSSLYASIILDGGSSTHRRLHIVGRGSTITTALHPTSTSQMAAILFVTGNIQLEVSGIKFLNTHPVISSDTCAIRLWGGTGLTLQQPHIHHCEFRNFSRALSVGGYDCLDVDHCRFILDLGSDSGNVSGIDPVVSVWAGADQTTNPANNTRVTNCYYNGCMAGTISGGATNKFSGDGFVFGQSNGWLVSNNIIQNHAFEAIYVQARDQELGPPPETSPSDRRQCLITNNLIDDTQPTGTVFGGPGSPDVVSIRCEESEALIGDNVIRNAINGIALDGINVAISPTVIRSPKISRNKIFMAPASLTNCFQGMYISSTTDAEITDNLVVFNGASGTGSSVYSNGLAGIGLNDANVGTIIRDNIVRDDDPSSTTTPIYSYWLQQSTSIDLDRNTSINIQFGINAPNIVPNPSGIITNHTWTNVTTPLAGNYVNILFPKQTVTFTPSSTGWYNILQISPASAAGRIYISAPLYDNTITDLAFDFNATGYGQDSTIVQTRYQPYNNGVVSAIRISNNPSNPNTAIDIQISTATSPQPVTITLEQMQVGVLLNQSPSSGAVLGNNFQLTCGEGLRTNAGLSVLKNAGFGTDTPTSAIHALRPGGTQVNWAIEQDTIQAWYGGMIAGFAQFIISNQSNLTTPFITLDPAGNIISLSDVVYVVMAAAQTSPPIEMHDSTATRLFFIDADGSVHPSGSNAGIYAGSFTNPNTHVTANTGSFYLNSVGGAGTTVWVKESGGLSNTGWVTAGSNLLDINTGYGTIPGIGGAAGGPSDLAIGAGGSSPFGVSFGFGDGSGYTMDWLSGLSGGTNIATLTDTGLFNVIRWIGIGVNTPSDTNPLQQFDVASDAKIAGNLGIGVAPDHTSVFPLIVGGAIKASGLTITGTATITFPSLILSGLTASRPVKTNGTKQLVSAAIDITSSDVTASGLTAGHFVGWGGSGLSDIPPGATATNYITAITGGPTSGTFVTGVSISAGVQSLTVTFDTALTGVTTGSFDVVKGLVQ